MKPTWKKQLGGFEIKIFKCKTLFKALTTVDMSWIDYKDAFNFMNRLDQVRWCSGFYFQNYADRRK